MKLIVPGIDYVFNTEVEKVNTIIVENQNLMFSILIDLQKQLDGLDGESVLSLDNKLLSINKSLEIVDHFIPFDLNKKPLISKIGLDLVAMALSDNNVVETNNIVGQLDSYLSRLTFDYQHNVHFTKINVESLVKAAGLEIIDDYDSLGEKLIDYFLLVNEFLGKKLFVVVNLRSFISDKEVELFMESVILHKIDVVMLENCEHIKTINEKRLIVDMDLCLIG